MAKLSDEIIGTWIGISHQSITVVTYRENGTFSGTYQTPAMDIKTSFDGNWKLKKDILYSHYIKSIPEFPIFMDNIIEDKISISGRIMFLKGINSSDLELEKVIYKEHWSKARMRQSLAHVYNAKPPTIKELKSLKFDDLFEKNPLINWLGKCVDDAKGNLHEDKELNALKSTIPKKAGYYYAILTFDGLRGNGGMQHVLLKEEIQHNQEFLKIVEKAFRHFGSKKIAELINELIPKSKLWTEQTLKLEEDEPPYTETEKIWEQVDRYDDIYDETAANDTNAYKALLKDIHHNPHDYTVMNP